MSKDASIRSLYEIRASLLGLAGLFQNAGDNGLSQHELDGIGTLIAMLSDRLAANTEAIELGKP